MNKNVTVLVVLAICVFAFGASANPIPWGGGFSVYADPAGTNPYPCAFVNTVLTLHVVHVGGPVASASYFRATKPDCMVAVWIGDESDFLFIGNSQTGVAVAYGACLTPPLHIMTINYFVTGITPDDCEYPLGAALDDIHAVAGYITIADCSTGKDVVGHVAAGQAVVNDARHPCVIPVEETTWGGVKALYSE